MATSTTSHAVSKLPISKWLANKSLKLNLINRRRSKSKSRSSESSLSSSSSLSPPNSPLSSNPMQTLRNDMNIIAPPNNITKEEEMRQVFRRFDANDDGKISALELRSYFGSIGEYMSHEQAKAVIDDFDTDGDELLDFQEFMKLMKRDGKEETIREERDCDLKSAFEMFELEKGCITPRSVQRMLCKLGDTRSYDECKAMVQVFDKDGNGVLDFHEFHQMMA